MSPRNRIKKHVTVRAGDLVVNEHNFRDHPETQKRALREMYDIVGFARSLLAYELPDGRLKLIDGHMRREVDPDAEVTVEVLDLTEEEALLMLSAVDPISAMAETNKDALAGLMELVSAGPALAAELQSLMDVQPAAFEPELAPETSRRQVTQDDVTKKQAEMESRRTALALEKVICPHCTGEFYVNPAAPPSTEPG